MASARQRRLMREYAASQKVASEGDAIEMENEPGLVAGTLRPIGQFGDLSRWTATIRGPPSTAYEDGRFKLGITCGEHYPGQPPEIKFLTVVCHPNVHFKTGEICLDVLKAAWSPAWTLSSACSAIASMLETPEATSPLNIDAANLIRCGDLVAYDSLVRMYVALHATGAD